MLQRVAYTDWHLLFPKIGIALFLIAFGIIVWKALSMEKRDSDRASRLPLDDE